MKMPSVQSIVIATSNTHKLKEIKSILGNPSWKILSLQDFPEIDPIAETGSTFQENALLKARLVFQHASLITLADDSGLEVDALAGAPGIISARYAGLEHDYPANNRKLLKELQQVPAGQRGAQFRCVVAIVGTGIEKIVEGIVRGRIIQEPRGTGGFGYDPLFIPVGYEKTYAELGEEVKNCISHRAIAFQKARTVIEQLAKSK
jgi:non-canonical purine NTP pyrophosphatase (RdgB/HAM1 family)